MSYAAHNEYLRFTVKVGYIRASLMGLTLVAMLVNLLRHSLVTKKWAFLMVAIAFFAYSATDNTFSVPQIFMALVTTFIGSCDNHEPVLLSRESRRARLFLTDLPVLEQPQRI